MDATMIQLVNDLELALLSAEEALGKAKRVSSIAADCFDEWRDENTMHCANELMALVKRLPDAARDHDIVHDYLVESTNAVTSAAVHLEKIRQVVLSGDATKP